MQCPNCKADIPEGSKFCLECGTALLGCCPSCGSANPASAKFCLECGHKLPATGVDAAGRPATDTATLQPAKAAGSAERRQLTVMFCDLVGSTALSARLDPEDMREIMSAYHHRCAQVIGKSGGFVAKYMGDGVLAYFGYPAGSQRHRARAFGAEANAGSLAKLGSKTDGPITARMVESLSRMPVPIVYPANAHKIGLLEEDAMDVVIVYGLLGVARDGVARLITSYRTPDDISPNVVLMTAAAFLEACKYARSVLPSLRTGVASHDDRDAELLQRINTAASVQSASPDHVSGHRAC